MTQVVDMLRVIIMGRTRWFVGLKMGIGKNVGRKKEETGAESWLL
jgi:hypothetical protein